MLDINKYSQSKKLQNCVFIQLKNPDTNEPEFTEDQKPVGFELHSLYSSQFKRAIRKTAHLDLTKDEKKKRDEINNKIDNGKALNDDELDFLDECDKKITLRFQTAYSMIIVKLHHVEIKPEDAELIGVEVTPKGKVKETQENILNLFIAMPGLSAQVGDAMAEKENFIKD